MQNIENEVTEEANKKKEELKEKEEQIKKEAQQKKEEAQRQMEEAKAKAEQKAQELADEAKKKYEEEFTRGTKVILYLKDGEDDFLDRFHIKHIIKSYSDHIVFPIQLKMGTTENSIETINTGTALWTKDKKDIIVKNSSFFDSEVCGCIFSLALSPIPRSGFSFPSFFLVFNAKTIVSMNSLKLLDSKNPLKIPRKTPSSFPKKLSIIVQ